MATLKSTTINGTLLCTTSTTNSILQVKSSSSNKYANIDLYNSNTSYKWTIGTSGANGRFYIGYNNGSSWNDSLFEIDSSGRSYMNSKTIAFTSDITDELKDKYTKSYQFQCISRKSTWSRLFYVPTFASILGTTFIVNLKGTRGNVVFSQTFLVEAAHAAYHSKITQLSSHSYSGGSARIICDNNGNTYFEFYDNGSSDGDCTLYINLLYLSWNQNEPTIYKTFTAGGEISGWTTITTDAPAGVYPLTNKMNLANSIRLSGSDSSVVVLDGLVSEIGRVTVRDHTKFPYSSVTSLNANGSLDEGIYVVQGSTTGQNASNHSVFININNIGTPFQLQIPDSSEDYIYKRHRAAGGYSWSEWRKIKAGYADSAGSADSAGTLSGFSQASSAGWGYMGGNSNFHFVNGLDTTGGSDCAWFYNGGQLSEQFDGTVFVNEGQYEVVYCQSYSNGTLTLNTHYHSKG